MRPYLEKNLSQKGAGGVAQGVGPEFKLQHHKKKWGAGGGMVLVQSVIRRFPNFRPMWQNLWQDTWVQMEFIKT
jgi:hypothetical protein